MSEWTGRRVVVIGLARQGKALSRYLAEHGAEVVVSDLKPAAALKDEMAELADVKIEYELGGHPEVLLKGCDALFLSGGVPAYLPLAIEARQRGIRLTNDAQLFLESAPAHVIGITGSAGKTTTTSLVAGMAQAAFSGTGRAVWLGGNIGRPLLLDLPRMKAGDVAVMELSSFQLELMTKSPGTAAVLNLTPDHLDRHGTMEAYVAAKRRILEHQSSSDWAVLNCDDALVWALRSLVRGNLIAFGMDDPGTETAAFVDEGNLTLRFAGAQHVICTKNDLRLRGRHNVRNVLAACALAAPVGVGAEAMAQVARIFSGVAHRLELVREAGGVAWYNDSIATTPNRTLAALDAFDEPVVLLLGGHDKDLPWDEPLSQILARADHLVLFGEAAQRLHSLVEASTEKAAATVEFADGLDEAVRLAARAAKPGMVVLLSPGCTSFDEFENYEARGERFTALVRAL